METGREEQARNWARMGGGGVVTIRQREKTERKQRKRGEWGEEEGGGGRHPDSEETQELWGERRSSLGPPGRLARRRCGDGKLPVHNK